MDLVQSQTQSYSDESLCRLAASGDPLAETELVGRCLLYTSDAADD